MAEWCSIERLISAIGLIAAIGEASRAAADEAYFPPVHWAAPSECPSSDVLRDGVRKLLGRSTTPKDISSLDIDISRESERSYSLKMTVRMSNGESHERKISGENCSAVIDAAAVALALAGDSPFDPPPVSPVPPGPVQPAAPLPPNPAPPPLAPVSPPPLVPPSAPDNRSSTRRHRAHQLSIKWDIGAFGGIDFASLPAPAPAFALSLTMALDANLISLRGDALIPERATLATQPTIAGHVGLYAARLTYGRSLFPGDVDLVPFGGLEAGVMVGTGEGTVHNSTGTGIWLAPTLGASTVFRLADHWFFSLDLEGLVLLSRPKFDINGVSANPIYQPPPATVRGFLGIHARF